MAYAIRIKLDPEATPFWITGRNAFTLRKLLDAGDKGCTATDFPAGCRVSHYIYSLRSYGLLIETTSEAHTGGFPGQHGRYRLVSRPIIVEDKTQEAA